MGKDGLHQPKSARNATQRFVIWFVLLTIASFALLLSPPLSPGVNRWTRAVADLAGVALRLFGGHVAVQGDVISSQRNGFSIRVLSGCNGIDATILVCCAMLAWRTNWRRKVTGLLLGCAVAQSANLLRLITLFLVGQWNQQWFDWLHEYVWEALIVAADLAVLVFWTQREPATSIAHIPIATPTAGQPQVLRGAQDTAQRPERKGQARMKSEPNRRSPRLQ
jgi:exosortase H (IPTLxxWG-CTERM-specific)